MMDPCSAKLFLENANTLTNVINQPLNTEKSANQSGKTGILSIEIILT